MGEGPVRCGEAVAKTADVPPPILVDEEELELLLVVPLAAAGRVTFWFGLS